MANDGAIAVSGAGTLTAGNLAGSGSMTVADSAMLTVHHVRQSSLTVNGNAQVTIRPTGCGAGPGQPAGTSVVKMLTMGRDENGRPTGRIDIANNHLIVDWSAPGSANPVDQVTAMLRAGYNAGTWTGPGIVSGRLGDGGWHPESVGVLDNSHTGVARYTTFGGLAVPSNATLVRYTLAGDADLDGTVDFTDLVAYSQNQYGTGKHWYEADFDYDGDVDFDDMVKLSQNYNQTLTCPGGGAQFAATGGGGDSDLLSETLGLLDEERGGWAVLTDIREALALHEPGRLDEFDVFVGRWWGDSFLMDGTITTAGTFDGAAALPVPSAAVPEPSGAAALGAMAVRMCVRRRRR